MDDVAREATLQAIGALTAYLNRQSGQEQDHAELLTDLIRDEGVDAVVRMYNGLLNLSSFLVAGAAKREDKSPAELLQGIALALEQGRL